MSSLALIPAPAEARFLRACLVARRDPQALDEARQLAAAGQLDWEGVWALAVEERVAPIVYHTMRPESLLPGWWLARSHEAYLQTGLANALRLQEVASVLQLFEQRGLGLALLKGAALLEPVYGNIALRPMVDVDLLVRRADAPRALAALISLGYAAPGQPIAADADLIYENELLLHRHDRLESVLELHWSLFDSPYYQARLPEATIWAATETAVIAEMPATVLAPEMHLLHLCGHLALHHRGRGLLWWNDIAEVIDRDAARFDWDHFLALAAGLELVLPVQAILPGAATEWAAPVPEDVLARLAGLAPTATEADVFARLTAAYRPPAQRLLDDLRGMDSNQARLRFLARNLFPPAAYMDERYQITYPVLRPFYYGWRWIIGLAGLLGGRSPG